MWLIWLLVFAALFIIGVVVFWIFSKIVCLCKSKIKRKLGNKNHG